MKNYANIFPGQYPLSVVAAPEQAGQSKQYSGLYFYFLIP
jgi:hypothetical protein